MEPLIGCGFFLIGGRDLCRWLSQRIGWQDGADIAVGVRGLGVDFECSWDGLF